jgi:hypothetical protein
MTLSPNTVSTFRFQYLTNFNAGTGRWEWLREPQMNVAAGQNLTLETNSTGGTLTIRATNPDPSFGQRQAHYIPIAGGTSWSADGTSVSAGGPAGTLVPTPTNQTGIIITIPGVALQSNAVYNSSTFAEWSTGKSGNFQHTLAITNTSNVRVFAGLYTATYANWIAGGQAPNIDCAVFRYSTNSANWFLYTSDGSSSTAADTGIAADNQPVRLRIQFNASANALTSVVGYINGVPVATNVATLPDTALIHSTTIQNLDTVTKGMSVFGWVGQGDW